MSETTLASVPTATHAASVGSYSAAQRDAINAIVTAQNANNTSLRAAINALPTLPVTSSELDPTTVQYATVNVSSAELLALFTTAKVLVLAPGAGKVIEFIRATISYLHVGTDYTISSSTNLAVTYKDKGGAAVSTTRATTGFIDGASAYSMFQPLTAQLALDTNAVNQPLCLSLAGANPTVGDGTLKVNIVYRVHTL